MRLCLRTAFEVYARSARLADNPPLAHDVMTPARLIQRRDRIACWIGPWEMLLVRDYLARRERPEWGKRLLTCYRSPDCTVA